MFKIVGNHDNQSDNSVLHKLIKQFVPYSQENLGWDQPVTINLSSDSENAQNPLGKTAHYEPNSKKVTIFTMGRHPKDILRSLSHELVHHKQNCQGLFTGNMDTGHGYAQEDEHLRNMEVQAYKKGNMCFRDWEDGIKQQKQGNKQMDISNIVNEVMGLLNEEDPEVLKSDWQDKQSKMGAAAKKIGKSWKEVTKDDGDAWTARLAAREAYKKMKKATAGDKEGAGAKSSAGSSLDPGTRQLYTKQLGVLNQYKTKIDGMINKRTKALANEGKQVDNERLINRIVEKLYKVYGDKALLREEASSATKKALASASPELEKKKKRARMLGGDAQNIPYWGDKAETWVDSRPIIDTGQHYMGLDPASPGAGTEADEQDVPEFTPGAPRKYQPYGTGFSDRTPEDAPDVDPENLSSRQASQFEFDDDEVGTLSAEEAPEAPTTAQDVPADWVSGSPTLPADAGGTGEASKAAAEKIAKAKADKRKRGSGKRVPMSQRSGGASMGRLLWGAMKDEAKRQGKKWNQLPYSHPKRKAYRSWLSGKQVSKMDISEDAALGAGRNPDEANEGVGYTGAGMHQEDTNENIEPGTGAEKTWKIKHKNKEGKTITLTLFAPESVYDDPKSRRREEEKARKKSDSRTAKKKKPEPKKRKRVRIPEETNENWLKGGKDQLLFEELTKRWTKKG